MPESDAQLCERLAKCESVLNEADNCGSPREVKCALCAGTDVCVAGSCRAPQCDSLRFETFTPVASANVLGLQDALAGVSSDGRAVLTLRRDCEASPGFTTPFTTFLIEQEKNGHSSSLELSSLPALAQMNHTDGAIFMSADGLEVIGLDHTLTSVLSSSRSGRGRSDFAPAARGHYANITVTPPAYLMHPVLSPDGLAFYYTLRGLDDLEVIGIYESVRGSKNEPFPAARRMGRAAQFYSAVMSVSEDRMTMFLQIQGYSMVVLTRRSLNEPFANPNEPFIPPTVPGFRTRIVGDCSTLMGTCVGGCNWEDTCIYSH